MFPPLFARLDGHDRAARKFMSGLATAAVSG
jgi:hypothetical protein